MRRHNSQNISFYAETLASIYLDTVSAVLPQDEIDRDLMEIRKRSRNEGMSFLTKTLPALGKSIDVSLAKGTALDAVHLGFKMKSSTNLPRFMHSLFRTVFRPDGVPWFATWYTDMARHRSGDFSPVDPTNELGEESEPGYMTRESCWSIWNQWPLLDYRNRVKRDGGEIRCDLDLLRKMYPSKERDAISVGLWQANSPVPEKEQVNSRREAMVAALRSLRQVCYSFHKLNLPYTSEQETKTLVDFVDVDAGLEYHYSSLDGLGQEVCRSARRIIRRVLANSCPLSGIPRHGPGAVATGERASEKHHFKRFYTRLDRVFKYDEWFFCNISHVCDSFTELQAMEELEAGTAKVVLVPKDSRGPRLISCEPLEYQWIQQSLMRVLVDTIESHWLTAGQVNFSDQTVNQRLALKGSADYSVVTLDMKEASDRVSLELVKDLFPERWYEALYASRTPRTLMPNGQMVTFKKFAPMGSAVCFPVEALIFWAICVATIMCTKHLPLRKAATKVFVYGDDIVCDAIDQRVISSILPKFGLMLNESKCCTAGPFKESCGTDAFFGQSVTPVKIRCVWCETPEPGMLASYVEYSNEFYRRGMYQTAERLEVEIQSVLRSRRMSHIPTVSGGEPGCIAFVRPYARPITINRPLGIKMRYNSRLHRMEVLGYRLASKLVMAKKLGWPFLLRKLTEAEAKKQSSSLEESAAHTQNPTGQYPIAHRVRLVRAWTPLK